MAAGGLLVFSILGILCATMILRVATLDAHEYFKSAEVNYDGFLWKNFQKVLVGYALAVAVATVAASLSPFYPGLWGPCTLAFAVFWAVCKEARPGGAEWHAPIAIGLEKGERIILLGGATGTLAAYVISL